jgi:hypothetical protein
MSLRSRARHLQRLTSLTYQQALERLRALGDAPAELHRRTGWPLAGCDVYLVAPQLDPEHRPEHRKGAARTLSVRSPLVVYRPIQGSTIPEVCKALCDATNARLAAVRAKDGRWLGAPLVTVKGPTVADIVLLGMLGLHTKEIAGLIAAGETLRPAPTVGASFVFTASVGGVALLMVIFDEASSLGLVRLRLRAREAVRAIERLLGWPWGGPLGGRGNGGRGDDEQLSVVDLPTRQRS